MSIGFWQSAIRTEYANEIRVPNSFPQETYCCAHQSCALPSPEPRAKSSPRLGLAHQSTEGGLQPRLQPDDLWPSRLCLGSGDPWRPSDVLVDDELIPSIAAKVSPLLGQQIA